MLTYSSFLSADFTRDGTTEVVSDTVTTLTWQDTNASHSNLKTWEAALNYCENLNFANSTAWRLANVNELTTLVDRTKKKLVIDDAFQYVGQQDITLYWTSSTALDHLKNKSWAINLAKGSISGKLKTQTAHSICVKDN
ncbi:MAG: Unknown protein [uncultured Sulfurovum sp.]|uniref:Lcl C-terminal domain-containing protein n=1 Tax=uncultured Sulfurovum sp. TaxID=269237 RepID=A0A6S6SDT8_9BACT|nr:MAG: Unknown protein [uncultured Sulfurovum sp.]